MKKLIVISSVMLSAALFFFSPARADQITAIKTSPAAPQEGDQVTVTLQGTGNCKTLDLDWGDGTGHYFSQPPNQNYSVAGAGWALPPHPYAKAGTFTIKVVSVKGCQGTGLTKTLTVAKKMVSGGGILDLCKIIDCGNLIPSPKISGFLIFSNFTPGGAIAVLGSGFGGKQGQLHMVATTAGSFKITDTVVPIIQGGWSNTSIGATIPSLSGVVDEPIKFYVVTAGNAKSNDSPTVQFRATQETKHLAYTDPAVKLISCGTDSNADWCNGFIDPDDGGPGNLFPGADTFTGGHLNCWGCFGDDQGSDVYQITLANGWVFDHLDFNLDVSAPGEASGQLVSNPPPGGASWQPTVNWLVTSNDWMFYMGNLYITGPKGVPDN